MLGVLVLVGFVLLLSLVVCGYHLFNYIVVLENYNALVLIVSLLGGFEESHLIFVAMMVLFVMEVSLMLVVVGFKLCGGCLVASVF